jgi:hypothetical protein
MDKNRAASRLGDTALVVLRRVVDTACLPAKQDNDKQDRDDDEKPKLDAHRGAPWTVGYSSPNLSVKNASTINPAKVASPTSTSSP